MISFKTYLLEKFNDLGKLSDDELKKGQNLKGDADDFTLVTSRVFHQAISKIRQNDIAKGYGKSKGLDSLSIYSPSEYSKMKCYLGKNNSSGYAIKGKDLVSVFSTEGKSASSIMKNALANGAKTLDCFAKRDKNGKISGNLYGLYSHFGWKIDTSMNSGKKGEAYTIINGVSDYVNDNGKVEPDNENVVIFMKHS